MSAVLTLDADSPLYGKQLAWASIFFCLDAAPCFLVGKHKGSFQAPKAGSYSITANLQTIGSTRKPTLLICFMEFEG